MRMLLIAISIHTVHTKIEMPIFTRYKDAHKTHAVDETQNKT